MAIAYRQDLWKQALNLLDKGLSIPEAIRLVDISRPTLYKWLYIDWRSDS